MVLDTTCILQIQKNCYASMISRLRACIKQIHLVSYLYKDAHEIETDSMHSLYSNMSEHSQAIAILFHRCCHGPLEASISMAYGIVDIVVIQYRIIISNRDFCCYHCILINSSCIPNMHRKKRIRRNFRKQAFTLSLFTPFSHACFQFISDRFCNSLCGKQTML